MWVGRGGGGAGVACGDVGAEVGVAAWPRGGGLG